MEKLCIIDHATHSVLIENVSDEELAKYDGSEEDYIKDNYHFEGDFSWDWVTSVQTLKGNEFVDITHNIDALA